MEVIREAIARAAAGTPFAMGTVILAQGSTPQKVGSTALVSPGAPLVGTLGGGLVEAQAIERLATLAESGGAELFEIRLDAPYSREAGPICGGVMAMYLNGRIGASLDALKAAEAAMASGDRGFLVNTLPSAGDEVGAVRWIPESSLGAEDVPFPAETLRHHLEHETSWLTDDQRYFLTPVSGPPRLLIVGGGHVGQSVARLGVYLGFKTTVVDDRPEFAHPDLFPSEVEAVSGMPQDIVSAFPKGQNTYIILVSKGHKPDAEALEGCIHDDVRYLGMIGSKRKVRFLRSHFIESGLATEEEFARVHTPIGYEIGAVTVPEIGVSIAAQLVAARRRPESLFAAPGMQLTGAGQVPREPVTVAPQTPSP